jgi:hypothetical protein
LDQGKEPYAALTIYCFHYSLPNDYLPCKPIANNIFVCSPLKFIEGTGEMQVDRSKPVPKLFSENKTLVLILSSTNAVFVPPGLFFGVNENSMQGLEDIQYG